MASTNFNLGALVVILLTQTSFLEGCSSQTYGDIRLLKPTGMKHGGVPRSQAQIEYTLSIGHLRPSKQCYVDAGQEMCVHPALIAAIASRESNFGDSIKSHDGWGDCHFNATTRAEVCYGYGLMQCDRRFDPVKQNSKGKYNCLSFRWDTCDHVKVMTRYVVVPMIKAIESKFANWKPEQQIQGGVAAYNTGPNRVTSWDGVDRSTTGHDYSNDVIARAQYLINFKHW